MYYVRDDHKKNGEILYGRIIGCRYFCLSRHGYEMSFY